MQTLDSVMNRNSNFARKKRRSLVRILASYIPDFLWEYLMPTVPRTYNSGCITNKTVASKPNNLQLDDTNSSFCAFKSYINNRKEQEILNSTPKREDDIENAKIRALQRELDEIKKQIAKIMERQSEQLLYSDYGTLSSPSEQLQKTSMLSPPPPPPPPPLPTQLLLNVNSPLKIETKKNLNLAPNKAGLPYGKELLKELKKVQLKKVEKSPGGGPLKKPKTDPGDFLEAVLKKRFGCLHNSPNSSQESANHNDSFGCEIHNASHDLQKSIKITVP